MTRVKKALLWAVAGSAGLMIALVVAAVVLVQTNWFKDRVRARIVSVAETATGGRVEIGSFQYDWRTLSAEVAPFVLHGKEAPGEAPLFRADRIRIGLKIISILESKVDIRTLAVEKPQVNIVVNRDGATNVPTPSRRHEGTLADELLDLKVRHFELNNGFARYNSEKIPINLEGDRLQASMVYEGGPPRYVGKVSTRQVRISSPGMKA